MINLEQIEDYDNQKPSPSPARGSVLSSEWAISIADQCREEANKSGAQSRWGRRHALQEIETVLRSAERLLNEKAPNDKLRDAAT